MTPRLPAVLSPIDLPGPELHAAKLDGELYPVDECFSPVDEVERVQQRALALAFLVPHGLIAEQRTAAWIYGVAVCPDRHQFCADINARVRPSSQRRITVREVVIEGCDVLEFAGLPVTTPLRTALDLARFSPVFTEVEAEMLAALMRLGRFGLDDCIAALNRRRNLPGKRQALARLHISAR